MGRLILVSIILLMCSVTLFSLSASGALGAAQTTALYQNYQNYGTCTDSDGGRDYYGKGVIYATIEGDEISISDTCLGNIGKENTLREWFCLPEEEITGRRPYSYEEIVCKNGCEDGACIKAEPTCTDSDGGRNYYLIGTVTYSGQPSQTSGAVARNTDWCGEDGITLHEHYCDGDTYEQTDYKCPNGCSGGGCKLGSEPFCSMIDTSNEGWFYEAHLVKHDNCDGCYAVCKHAGSESEGWYSSCDSSLIKWEDCEKAETVEEEVKCIFEGSATTQKCYSEKGECSGVEACNINIEGEKGEKVTWKSTCGGYAYTTMDGQEEYATFDCTNKCAEEGEHFSKVYTDEYPEECCAGLTEWMSGMDTRISIGTKCYGTGMLAGWPVGTCINCGNDVCEDVENPCNCLEDCNSGENADYATVEDFCARGYSKYCGAGNPMDLELCTLCEGTCRDSDGGKDYYSSGSVTYAGNVYKDWCSTNRGNGGHVYLCTGENCHLVEVYCSEETEGVDYSLYNCPNGCEDGACVSGITVISPNGGEKWIRGSIHEIRWLAPSSIDAVSISLGRPDDTPTSTSGMLIAENVPNNGRYKWNISPSISTEGQWLIRINKGTEANVYDKSDAPFHIVIGKCVDSDNGKNLLESGYCTDKYGTHWDGCWSPNAVTEQYCNQEKNLCEEDRSEESICPEGYRCHTGACIRGTTCTDSDGGKNYRVKGTVTVCNLYELDIEEEEEPVTGGSSSVNSSTTSTTTSSGGGSGGGGDEGEMACAVYTDECTYCTGACEPGEPCEASCGAVKEYYCDGNEMKTDTYICPNNCVDGACVQKTKCEQKGGYCTQWQEECKQGYEGAEPMDCPGGRSAQCCLPVEPKPEITLKISSPYDGEEVSGTIKFRAKAVSTSEMKGMSLEIRPECANHMECPVEMVRLDDCMPGYSTYPDRKYILQCTYKWNTAPHAGTKVRLAASVMDESGASARDSVSVYVKESSRLTIDILSPKEGQTVSGVTKLKATAKSNTKLDKMYYSIHQIKCPPGKQGACYESISTWMPFEECAYMASECSVGEECPEEYGMECEYQWDSSSYKGEVTLLTRIYDVNGNTADDKVSVYVASEESRVDVKVTPEAAITGLNEPARYTIHVKELQGYYLAQGKTGKKEAVSSESGHAGAGKYGEAASTKTITSEEPSETVLCKYVEPPECPNGKLVPKYDENGCVIDYDCTVPKPCPEIAPPSPEYCPSGKIVPVYENGCIVSYKCVMPFKYHVYNLKVGNLPPEFEVSYPKELKVPVGGAANARLIVTPTAYGEYPFKVTVTALDDTFITDTAKATLKVKEKETCNKACLNREYAYGKCRETCESEETGIGGQYCEQITSTTTAVMAFKCCCGTQKPRLSVRTDKSLYNPGETVRITVKASATSLPEVLYGEIMHPPKIEKIELEKNECSESVNSVSTCEYLTYYTPFDSGKYKVSVKLGTPAGEIEANTGFLVESQVVSCEDQCKRLGYDLGSCKGGCANYEYEAGTEYCKKEVEVKPTITGHVVSGEDVQLQTCCCMKLAPPPLPVEGASLSLDSGWNLMAFPGISELINTSCGRPYGFIHINGKYVSIDNAKDYFGSDEKIMDYLRTHAFWVFSKKACTMEFEVTEYTDYKELELEKGWNFVPITKDMEGLTLGEVLVLHCEIEKALIWKADANKWEVLNSEYRFEEKDLHKGILIKAAESCKLGG